MSEHMTGLMSEEVPECPRRIESPHQFPLPDTWGTTRWGVRDSDVWNWPWHPRTCPYCGGVHPEDGLKLIREGWSVEMTTKGYKAYLHPPGYAERTQALFSAIGNDAAIATLEDQYPDAWSAVPPVKIYGQHWDVAQLGELNLFIRGQRQTESARSVH